MSKPEDNPSVEPDMKPVVQALEHWQDELDPVQRARLTAARRRALSASAEGARAYGWLAPALAAGVLLAVGIGFWPQATLPPAAVPPPESLAAGEAITGDEALIDEDAEYLLWLASNDAA